MKSPISINIHKKQVAIFCGAGISILPPAGLPNWAKLKDYSLEAIASKIQIPKEYLQKLINIRPEHAISQISRCYKNYEKYFENFKALEEGQPNANHLSLANMAKNGYLKYIITTNWDLFIEKAMKDANVNYQVYKTEKEFQSFEIKDDDKVHILKLHGCISDYSTIMATVEQQSKGLSPAKRNALDNLFSKFYFIFLGYSGADLDYGLDYFRMESNKSKSLGFVWYFIKNSNYKRTINPNVQKLVSIYAGKAHIEYGELPKIFKAIISKCYIKGCYIKGKKYTSKEINALQERKNKELLDSLKKWSKDFMEKYVAWNIFGCLLEYVGCLEEAENCYRKSEEVTPQNNILSRLAIQNNIANTLSRQKKYDQALEIWKKNYNNLFPYISSSDDVKHEFVTICINISCCYDEKEEYDKAFEYICQAEKLEENSYQVLNQMGRFYLHTKQYDNAIPYFQKALESNKNVGEAYNTSKIYTNLGLCYYYKNEYDEALSCYKNGIIEAKKFNDKETLAILNENIRLCEEAKNQKQIP